MFRLNIDFPLGEDEQKAKELTEYLIGAIKFALLFEKEKTQTLNTNEFLTKFNDKLLMQYRMSKDEDRTIKNYLVKDENGHCVRSKTQFEL